MKRRGATPEEHLAGELENHWRQAKSGDPYLPLGTGLSGQSVTVRAAIFLTVVGVLLPACSDDASDGRFELEGEELHGAERDPVGPLLSAAWGTASAAVIEAPAVATAGDTVEVLIELRNPEEGSLLSLDPCPRWEASIAAETLSTRLAGALPCDELERIEAGERVQFVIAIRAPADVDCHDGYDPDFYWALLDGGDVAIEAAPVNIPMRKTDSAAPNDCGGRAGTTVPPPDLERT